jgi:prolipoprotein diacylglyceryltransferase
MTWTIVKVVALVCFGTTLMTLGILFGMWICGTDLHAKGQWLRKGIYSLLWLTMLLGWIDSRLWLLLGIFLSLSLYFYISELLRKKRRSTAPASGEAKTP